MAFKDSYNKWEPIGGYGWEKTWRPLADENFHTGLGLPPVLPRVITGTTFRYPAVTAGIDRVWSGNVPDDLHSGNVQQR
jgi:hypothetical protein